MEFHLEDICQRLQIIRKKLDFTQNKFAEALEISQSSYNDNESGKVFPRFELLFALALKFNVNLGYLFFGNEPIILDKKKHLIAESPIIDHHLDFFYEFIEYFENSTIYRHAMMMYHSEFITGKADLLEMEQTRLRKTKPAEKMK